MATAKKSIYNGSDKSTSKNKPVMSRTSGVARRKADTAGKLLNTNEIKTALKKGGPLTGSASGVKSISTKQAGEVLTSGIVTLGKKGFQVDPAGLAMALPVGKVAKAAKALLGTSRFMEGIALQSRVAAKVLGKKNPFRAGLSPDQQDSRIYQAIGRRNASERVFPRLNKENTPLRSKKDLLRGLTQDKLDPAAEMKRIATKGFTKSEIDEFTDFATKYYDEQEKLRKKFGKK